MDKSQELREVLLRYLDADLERIIFSNPRTRESYLKLTVRPLLLRGALAFHRMDRPFRLLSQVSMRIPPMRTSMMLLCW